MSSQPNGFVNEAHKVPPELQTLIIRQIPHYEKPTLRNCCLVARSWCTEAQLILFSHLSIKGTKPTVAIWNDKFDENPHLLRMVKYLRLYGGSGVFSEPSQAQTDMCIQLVNRLNKVIHIEISEFTGWQRYESLILKALQGPERPDVHSLKVTMLSLDLDDWIDLVHSMPKLRSLSSYDLVVSTELPDDVNLGFDSLFYIGTELVRLDSQPEFDSGEQKPAKALDKLALHGLYMQVPILMWLLSPAFDLSCLRELTLAWDGSDTIQATFVSILDEFLAAAGLSVNHLAIRVGFNPKSISASDLTLRNTLPSSFWDTKSS